MESNPSVTIVLPVYNGERFLTKSIDSIINQTYKNYELIIVDDSSIDATSKIIKYYSDKDSRIKSITNMTNKGLPYSLNRGFELSKGDYLTWTSDDNMYHEQAIEKMVSFLAQNEDCGLVFADMNLVDENDEIIGSRITEHQNIYSRNCVGACFMYRSECKEIIGDYDEKKGLVEDYDYWLRIASIYRIERIPEVLYDYRYHNNSLTIKKMKQVGERLADLRLKYIERIEHNVDEETYREILFEMIVCIGERVLSVTSCSNIIDINQVINRKKEIHGDGIWLFGAGGLGRSALGLLHDKRIKGFIDNDTNKIGRQLLEKPIISLKQFLEEKSDDTIVISTELRYAYRIMMQLHTCGVDNIVLLYDVVGNEIGGHE